MLLQTPPDPCTGATTLRLDPLELIHRMALQVPDRGQHLVRYSGAYANRVRRLYRPAEGEEGASGGGIRSGRAFRPRPQPVAVAQRA